MRGSFSCWIEDLELEESWILLLGLGKGDFVSMRIIQVFYSSSIRIEYGVFAKFDIGYGNFEQKSCVLFRSQWFDILVFLEF